jgi:hypothetical protein
MQRKITTLLLLLQIALATWCQPIPVSTGLNTTLTGAVPLGGLDPYWKVVGPNPSPLRITPHFPGYWQPTPVAGTNAGWVNHSGTLFSNPPGIHIMERDFVIPLSTASFSCSFSITYDDLLPTLELVRPDGTTIPLSYTPPSPWYTLSSPITNTVNAPAAGTWKIRAHVNFVDNVGAFMLSGYINKTPCRKGFVVGLDKMGGTAPGIFENPAGGFFATGLIADSTVIAKSDASGNVQWIQKFKLGNGFYQIMDLKVDAGGDLIGIAHKQGATYGSSMGFRCNATATAFAWIFDNPDVVYAQFHLLSASEWVVTGTHYPGGYSLLEHRSTATGAIASYSWLSKGGDYFSTLSGNNLYGTCRRYYNSFGDFRAAIFSHDINSGNFLWENAIISEGNTTGPNQTRMYPVAPVVDNNDLVTLASGDLIGFDTYSTGPVEMTACKTDLLGNVQWTKQYTIANHNRPVGMVIKNTASGYYMVANLYVPGLNDFGYTVVIKTNKNGQVQWAKRLGLSGKNMAYTAVENGGNLYLSMSSDSYSPNQLLLIKLAPTGIAGQSCEFIQSITVRDSTLQNIQSPQLYCVSDNVSNEIAASTTPHTLPLNPKELCKVDCPCLKDSGNNPIDAFVFTPASGFRQVLSVAPNPATDMVTLSLMQPVQANTRIQVADLSGRKLGDEIWPSATRSTQLKTAQLVPGSYQVMVYTNGQLLAMAKLIKQ